jgi:putative phosphoribosyl transferase
LPLILILPLSFAYSFKAIQNNDDTKHLKIGYFGISTGAAAALYAASFHNVKAIVLPGGRARLGGKKTLEDVTIPCLFIVGGNDKKLIEINKKSVDQLTMLKSSN